MKNIIVIILLSFSVACAQKEQTTPVEPVALTAPTIPVLEVSMYDSPLVDNNVALEHPYDITYVVEKTGENTFDLITTMKLFGGSFYVSPHSPGNFTGQFRIEVAPNENLSLAIEFNEIPRSKEVIDPHQFVNGPVNWVSEDTRYEHHININTEEDFSIGGKIKFTIEPKCTLEEIPVMFKYKAGVLTVEPWKC